MKSLRQLYHCKRATATSAVTLLMLLAIAAILVDLGHMFVVREQIREAAEAGAEAGARALAYGTTLNFQMAISTATATVRTKAVNGVLLRDFNTDDSLREVQVGYWDLSWTRDTAPATLHGDPNPALCPLRQRGSGGKGEYCQDLDGRRAPGGVNRLFFLLHGVQSRGRRYLCGGGPARRPPRLWRRGERGQTGRVKFLRRPLPGTRAAAGRT